MTHRHSVSCLTLALLMTASPLMMAKAEPCPATGDLTEANCLYAQGVEALEKSHDQATGNKLLMAALDIREKQTVENDTPEQAEQYLALADIYRALGRSGKAEPMYRKALHVIRTVKGPDSIETVPVVDRLALMLMDQGRFVEAEPGLKTSVRVIEKEKGVDSPDLIPTLDKLAWICGAGHRPTEANAYRKRIDAIKAKAQ